MDGKLTGGPAFPGVPEGWNADGTVRAYGGMELRDYFAAKAMLVYMAEKDGPDDDNPGHPRFNEIEVSHLAYLQADAMLEARSAA